MTKEKSLIVVLHYNGGMKTNKNSGGEILRNFFIFYFLCECRKEKLLENFYCVYKNKKLDGESPLSIASDLTTPHILNLVI
jgi:hypothetical protein